MVGTNGKLGALFGATSLVVTFTRHILSKGWGSSLSIGTLLSGVFIHFLALSVLFVIWCLAISRFHRYFLGHEEEQIEQGNYSEMQFYFLMVIMTLSVAALVGSIWPSTDIGD
jgi:hypothetical protein